MGVDIKSGLFQFPEGNELRSEEIFHKFLSKIDPRFYQLERLSIYEAPMRAELEFAAKGPSELKPVVSLELSENDNTIRYSIVSEKPAANSPNRFYQNIFGRFKETLPLWN